MIREARREQRLTQEDVAFAAGLSTGTLHNIEHGKLSARLETLQRILSILGLTLEVTKRSTHPTDEAPDPSRPETDRSPLEAGPSPPEDQRQAHDT